MMRIGMVTGEYPPMQGGVGAYTSVLAHQLADKGQTLEVISHSGSQSSSALVQVTGSIDRWGISSLRTVQQWAQFHRLDLVNLQFETAAYGMSPYIHFLPDMLRPIPVVTTFHDLNVPYLFPKAGALRNWIVMRLARASKGVIATNHDDFMRLRKLRALLIPIGSNISRTQHGDAQVWRAQAGAAHDDFLLVYFGLINQSKGLDTLLDSLSQLSDLPIRLVIAGAGTGSSDPTNAAYAQQIDAQAAKLNLGSRIVKTGYLDDASVSSYLSAADAVVLPYSDGASYRRGTLMAALQEGCPIITTKPQGSIPSFIDGQNMLLVAPGDPAALAAAMRRLYEAPDLRAKLQQGARELAGGFDWGEIGQETLNFFQRIVGAKA